VPAAATVTGAGSLPEGWTATSFGPLGPADRELLVRVRQAGLWENPAGLLARDRAADKRVKEVGAQLANDHHGLDEQVRQVAAQLGVALPDKATAEQQGWVQELTGKKGADFDVTFANRLRAAHGKVFGLVGAVRSGTQNELIRSFAQTAVNVVMKHMTLLESIGNVDYGALPTPAAAAASTKPSTADAARANLTGTSGAIWLVVALAVIAGVSSAIRTIRARRGTF
jgi:predicted outer membrane protein